jgi:predicted DCC family thiol-disulfide oxidoreductase YuxK
MPNAKEGQTTILFYDGECSFCSGIVRFMLEKDRYKKLHFAPLGGDTFKEKQVPLIDSETIIIYTEQLVLYKSSAAIYALKLLGGGWSALAKVMGIFPKFFRDFIYDCIGRVRYLLVSKNNNKACPMLPKEYRDRILT